MFTVLLVICKVEIYNLMYAKNAAAVSLWGRVFYVSAGLTPITMKPSLAATRPPVHLIYVRTWCCVLCCFSGDKTQQFNQVLLLFSCLWCLTGVDVCVCHKMKPDFGGWQFRVGCLQSVQCCVFYGFSVYIKMTSNRRSTSRWCAWCMHTFCCRSISVPSTTREIGFVPLHYACIGKHKKLDTCMYIHVHTCTCSENFWLCKPCIGWYRTALDHNLTHPMKRRKHHKTTTLTSLHLSILYREHV